MASVGVRELRQRASELLRLVEAGATIEITDRGRPVALLTPLPGGDRLSKLRLSGDVSVAVGNLNDLPDPLGLPEGFERVSELLANLRADER